MIIIDDDNVCKACGAYFTDLEYCVNGHLSEKKYIEMIGKAFVDKFFDDFKINKCDKVYLDIRYRFEILDL